MKKILLYLLILIILLNNSNFLEENLQAQEENEKIIHKLRFKICFINYEIDFYIRIDCGFSDAQILFNGSLYNNYDIIDYKAGRYEIKSVIARNYKFLLWFGSKNIIFDNYLVENTNVTLLKKHDEIRLTIVEPYIIYSYITLLLTKNNTPFNIIFPNTTHPYLEVGNLEKNIFEIVNKINNKTNFKFIPYESIKIRIKIQVNETKPLVTNPTQNEKTIIEIQNFIINNSTLIKRENFSINPVKILNWNYSEIHNELIDVKKTFKHIYPEKNYGLGISENFGHNIIGSFSKVKITWSWNEITREGIIYREVIKEIFGINITLITISSLILKVLKTEHKENIAKIEIQFLWIDDLTKVLNKEKVLAINALEIGITSEEINSEGKANLTLKIESIKNTGLKISDLIKIKPQFKNNGTIINSPINFIKWSKIATIVKEIYVTNNSFYVKLQIIDYENFKTVNYARVSLFIDENLFEEKFTNEIGEVEFSFSLLNYYKISVKVKPTIYSNILISSEFSDIILYVKIWP